MNHKIVKFLLGIGMLSLLLLVITVTRPNDQYRVIFCDVGQGDAILVTAPNHVQILIDGGPDQRVLEKLGKYMPFNDRTIEMVMVTHPHADHLAGLLEVARRYRIGRVVETDMPGTDSLSSSWSGLLRQRDIPVTLGQTDSVWRFGADLELRIVYASEKSAESAKDLNELSLVSLVSISGRRFLMTGDMNLAMEEAIMSAGRMPPVDVLKVAHHGSHFATATDWLETIHPAAAIISVGQPNRYGHPAPEVLARLQRYDVPYWRTDQSGDVSMILKNDNWVTQTDKHGRIESK